MEPLPLIPVVLRPAFFPSARRHCADRELSGTGQFAGQDVSLRWIYVHIIEEYARHNGHADLLRERIDGATGV